MQASQVTEPRLRFILSQNPAYPGQTVTQWVQEARAAGVEDMMRRFGWQHIVIMER